MSSSPTAFWKTVRNDEWWWSGTPTLSGSLYQGIRVFSIDNTFGGTAQQLWAVLEATARQFPRFQILCIYDARTKESLDQLQHEGRLRWSDAGNPYSSYAGIDFIRAGSPSAHGAQASGLLEPEDQPQAIHAGAVASGAFSAVSSLVALALVIGGTVALLSGMNDPYRSYGSDRWLTGAAEILIGVMCIAAAIHWRPTRAARLKATP